MLLLYGQTGEITFTTVGESDILDAMVGIPGTVDFVGDTSSGSATLANVSNTHQMVLGMTVTGAGIPLNATIIALTATGMTLSANATATATAVPLVASGGTVPGTYEGALVMLYTIATTLPAKNATITSLGEATYTGYARSTAISWGTPVVNAAGVPFVTGDKKQFVVTGSGTTNDIQGAAILDATGMTVLQVCPFPNPIGMSTPGNGFDFVPVLSFTAQQ